MPDTGKKFTACGELPGQYPGLQWHINSQSPIGDLTAILTRRGLHIGIMDDIRGEFAKTSSKRRARMAFSFNSRGVRPAGKGVVMAEMARFHGSVTVAQEGMRGTGPQ